MSDRYSAQTVLSTLKDFQQRTVEYVFSRLYGTEAPVTRFLVADEVGLGKTLIAKGVIAKIFEKFLVEKKRIDIIYICSNAAIAKQNIRRLNTEVPGVQTGWIDTRLTLLPRDIHKLKGNKINYICMTPRTAFEQKKNSGGRADERVVLYHLLEGIRWGKGRDLCKEGLLWMLQCKKSSHYWPPMVRSFQPENLDVQITIKFRTGIQKDEMFMQRLKNCCMEFAYDEVTCQATRKDRYPLIAELQKRLARTCISVLKPKLIILDEFQRFKDLLHENGEDDEGNDAARLAQSLFRHKQARMLLLSATPYKMYSQDAEKAENNHYDDFIKTLLFLREGNEERLQDLQRHLREHRISLLDFDPQTSHRREIEQNLLEVMCRTEKGPDQIDKHSFESPITPNDLFHAEAVARITQCIGAEDFIEYWKSTPYLVNYLKHYDLRKKLDRTLQSSANEEIVAALRTAKKKGQLLVRGKFSKHADIKPGNARMRFLFEKTIEKNLWQLLWMPPTMPYYEPAGLYEGKGIPTKFLVFSSWKAVPDAIASLCSYEAERRMLGKKQTRRTNAKIPSKEQHRIRKSRPLLRFAKSKGRYTGMPVLAWMLPCVTLATKIDPLRIALQHGGSLISAQKMRVQATVICRELLDELKRNLPEYDPEAASDPRWYWVAPAMLDKDTDFFLDWCKDSFSLTTGRDLEGNNPEKDGGRFSEHVATLVKVLQWRTHQSVGGEELGSFPEDLHEVLCELALGGPGTCALRALLRLGCKWKSEEEFSELMDSAAKIASGFRSLFNLPDSIALITRGKKSDAYWFLTLQYCVSGNIQSMLDEYIHLLKESLGAQGVDPIKQAASIAEQIYSALTLRSSQISIDDFHPSNEGFTHTPFNIQCKFALRLKEDKEETDRPELVQNAFNSPFRPFVLASTSIGQEGLDFHPWCHAVVHWNLPSNPVDLEQREGRVSRYKGHAVRKNIAGRFGLDSPRPLEMPEESVYDPWDVLFSLASKKYEENQKQNELVPFWVFENELPESAKIERHVPLPPFSRDIGKLERLEKHLALYRLVFGQPCQEDLLKSLSLNDGDRSDWFISLEPPDE